MTSVCLAVMAKNEAPVIARCLASAKPLVTSWVVVDTGSTDATAAIAREVMGDLAGEVVQRPWRDYGWNRTESFNLARTRADYTLYVDADDALEYPPGARFPELTESAYELMIHDGPLVYSRRHLFKNSLPWRFEGIRHEAAVCEGAGRPARLTGIIYRRIGGGARSRDPGKYLQDAAALEDDLRRDPANARNVFYLAQSYEDGGDNVRALANYERRALMGGWPEEVYEARFAAARVRGKLGLPPEQVEKAYLEASEERPQRAEPLYYLAALAREAGDWGRARSYAASAAALPFPHDESLFIRHEIYAWRALDEFAAACVGMKDWPAAIEACNRLLTRDLPPAERARIEANLASCRAALRLV
jgi:Glycosyl transferase family 2